MKIPSVITAAANRINPNFRTGIPNDVRYIAGTEYPIYPMNRAYAYVHSAEGFFDSFRFRQYPAGIPIITNGRIPASSIKNELYIFHLPDAARHMKVNTLPGS